MAKLFPIDFVAAVSRMRLSAGSVPRGGRNAEHGSAQLGGGMEFRDFRSYMPGDDIRRIDWNLYRRSGKLFLRLFEEERDLPVYILLDCSDSMFFEEPPRSNAAKQAAAVLIGAALNQHDRPVLYPFGETLNEGFPAISHARALPATLESLAAIGPSGPTNLCAVLHRLNAMRLRRGVVAIVSDFFDPAGIDAQIESLHGMPHKLLLVQLVRESDAKPQLDGELLLSDCATGHPRSDHGTGIAGVLEHAGTAAVCDGAGEGRGVGPVSAGRTARRRFHRDGASRKPAGAEGALPPTAPTLRRPAAALRLPEVQGEKQHG